MTITHPGTQVVGHSAWAAATRRHIAEFAGQDQHCLIDGPPSSGRAVLARAIHERSACCDGPFVPVSCDSLPGHLFTSQVFGCVAGVMSENSMATVGAARAANGGTLFLRHVDELDLFAQRELLGFLAHHDVQPVGGTRSLHANVRVIASCSRNIQGAIQKGQFAADLHQQLAGKIFETVDLAVRSADIIPLAEQFLHERCAQLGLSDKTLEPSAVEWLLTHPWLGNAGSLRTLMQGVAGDVRTSSIDHETIGVWLANRDCWPRHPTNNRSD